MKVALSIILGCITAALPVLSGCVEADRAEALRQTGGNAALVGQFQAFDGRTAEPISFDQVVAMAGSADIVLYGEEHSDVVCNAIEAQLLSAMSRQERPVTLAMEFFEDDTQTALTAYLNGRIDENEFRKLTRQKRAYFTAHRPLIEFCRMTHIPVIAANAPWRLTRALRLSGKPYDEFRASLNPEDRALLPASSEPLSGPYHDRFVAEMAEHMKAVPSTASQPATQPTSQPTTQATHPDPVLFSYRAQSLWDDTMAQSIAENREDYPDRRVMLIVGRFHIASEGGTLQKVRRKRPHDRLLTIVYHGTSSTPLVFDVENRAAGDIVICGIAPPEEPEPAKPMPTTAASEKAAPTTTAPTSQGSQ